MSWCIASWANNEMRIICCPRAQSSPYWLLKAVPKFLSAKNIINLPFSTAWFRLLSLIELAVYYGVHQNTLAWKNSNSSSSTIDMITQLRLLWVHNLTALTGQKASAEYAHLNDISEMKLFHLVCLIFCLHDWQIWFENLVTALSTNNKCILTGTDHKDTLHFFTLNLPWLHQSELQKNSRHFINSVIKVNIFNYSNFFCYQAVS